MLKYIRKYCYSYVCVLLYGIDVLIGAACAQDMQSGIETTAYKVEISRPIAENETDAGVLELLLYVKSTAEIKKIKVEKAALNPEAFIAKDRFFCVMGLGNGGSGFYLCSVSIDTANVENCISSHFPYISPDEEWIAYKGPMPRRVKTELAEPTLRIASLSTPLLENTQVYPIGLEDNHESDGRVHNVVSPILWNFDSSSFIFFDAVTPYGSWENCSMFVVKINISTGLDKITQKRAEINPRLFLNSDDEVTKPGFTVQCIDWMDEHTFKIKPLHITGFVSDSMEFSEEELFKDDGKK